MKMVEKMAPRVLLTALLAVLGLALMPGASLAQSALQALPLEIECESELQIINPTPQTLCAYVWVMYSDGDCADTYSYLIPPLGNNNSGGDYDLPWGEDMSVFILSSYQAPNGGGCTWQVRPAPGLRSWAVQDDTGTTGVNAVDVPLSATVLNTLFNHCL